MPAHEFSVSALIQVPAQHIYAIIADYHHGHPQIIPKPPFVSLVVEQGGIGSGTVIRMETDLLGKIQTVRSTITEPEPGRILLESNDNGYSTSFTVEPRADGQHAYVTITTRITKHTGIMAAIECWFAKRLLQPVYIKELDQLALVGSQSYKLSEKG